MRKFKLVVILLVAPFVLRAQEDLMEMLDEPEETKVMGTFKSTRLINGHSVKVRAHKVLEFVVGHRFGRVNNGAYGFWGLDNANIRLGLTYGLFKNFNIGIGRSSVDKTFDTYAKYRLLQQSDKTPVTVTLLGAITFATDSTLDIQRRQRYDYTSQILIARKFNSRLSLQIMPTYIHRPLVPTNVDDNNLFALGIGGRLNITSRVTFNLEYYPQLTDFNENRFNAIAIGVDIETGGHVFQLHLTNARQMTAQGFVGETNGDFFDADIHFGFNISRVFHLGSQQNIEGY